MNNPTKKIDFVAFSGLRPGIPYNETKNILLSHWRELRNKDEGSLYLLKFGCAIRIDCDGILGEVSYFSKFPPKRDIEGVTT